MNFRRASLISAPTLAVLPTSALAAGGDLWTYGTAGSGDTHLGMMAGTSPAIAALRAGDRISITIRAPGYTPERAVLVIRNGAEPTAMLL